MFSRVDMTSLETTQTMKCAESYSIPHVKLDVPVFMLDISPFFIGRDLRTNQQYLVDFLMFVSSMAELIKMILFFLKSLGIDKGEY